MKKKKKAKENKRKFVWLSLPEESKKWILGILMFLVAIVIALSFFDLAGPAGHALIATIIFLIGKGLFTIPIILVLAGLCFFSKKEVIGPTFLGAFVLIFGISGLLECLVPLNQHGGWIGFLISWPFLKFFGSLVSKIVFSSLVIIGSVIFWYIIKPSFSKNIDEENANNRIKTKIPLVERIVQQEIKRPSFKIKQLSSIQEKPEKETTGSRFKSSSYSVLPIDLLDKQKEKPTAGDIKANSDIIEKTLSNFDIGVDMREVNVGPAVTQYSLKPAEGIRLSKITALNSNLSLALALHPIRIEAPIPGKSLIGIELPNRVRAKVRLRELISNSNFQNNSADLLLALGKDVSGKPINSDLSRMPHLLVAGATGSGKTIFLNSLIMSLIYRTGPEILRFIMIDPKRVEFSVYKKLPHLLAPVIFNADKTVSALSWLTSEMERRFDLLAEKKTRNIKGYNEKLLQEKEKPLPYIVFIIDELADLMMARGKDIESGIVRLAQMSRAVGIHLVVATQRPSVEVVTGLIKANITSRVAFQVASQIDSRTILDMAGAEKLLGLGDMLFISSTEGKPKRIQGAYVSEEEVRKVVNYVHSRSEKEETEETEENELVEGLEKALRDTKKEVNKFWDDEDPLYEQAKKLVIESKKASASLLQRRLRLGYARAARIIDMLEENGVIGPSSGAKPREVYLKEEQFNDGFNEDSDNEDFDNNDLSDNINEEDI